MIPRLPKSGDDFYNAPASPPLPTPRPANSTMIEAANPRRPLRWAILVTFVVTGVFAWKLADEPHFMDESAYVAQSYYLDLLIEGKRNAPDWLEYAGYDLPPLAKYLVGGSLRLFGYPRPSPMATLLWYENPGRKFADGAILVAARVPSVLLGALGCGAIYWIGRRALGHRSGLVAAGLLAVEPLYMLHSRRAMSDIPAESCLVIALAFALEAWRGWFGRSRTWSLGLIVGTGLFAGLSVLSKLNGVISLLILMSWVGLACLAPWVVRTQKGRLILAAGSAGLVAFGLFVAANPFLTAQPTRPIRPDLRSAADASFWERVRVVKRHRESVSIVAQSQFPDDRLPRLVDKVQAVAVQGFGRFSPFGPRHSNSKIRFDWRQDWGAILWWPLVLVGLVVCARRGWLDWRRGQAPVTWALILGWGVAMTAVTSFIPLAWDRYYLSIQPWSALMAAAAVGRVGRWGVFVETGDAG